MTAGIDPQNFNAVLDELVRGSSDMHVHFAPDVRPDRLELARRLDGLETLRSAQEAGMRAIVLKSHYWPTGALAQTLQPLVSATAVFGMVVLNYQYGDRLNPFAAEVGAMTGCKILMGPTMHTREAVRGARAAGSRPLGVRDDQEGLTIVDHRGELLPEMEEILDIAQQYGMVMATGHLRAPDDHALVAGAHRRGLTTIVTHVEPSSARLDEHRWMVAHGAVIEWNGNLLHPQHPIDVDLTIAHARAVGVENSCLTTDSGQAMKPPVAECLRMFLAQLLVRGMDVEEVATMARDVPARVLDLDSPKGAAA
jgi:hypothetical protein